MSPRPPARLALVLLGLGAAVAGAAPGPPGGREFTFAHENVMGTSLEMRVVARTEADARGAEARALLEIDRLSAVFSNHDPSSEFRRWRAADAGPVAVSAELFEVLAESDRWIGLTGGAFDPRAQTFAEAWKRAASEGRVPSPAELAGAKSGASQPAWRLDHAESTAWRRGDAPISLDAIAKGFIVERASEAALRDAPGVTGLSLNVGGDFRVVGDLSITVGIVAPWADSEGAEPLTRVEVKGRAVATSGRSQRGYSVNGRWYSHVIDPRTGSPAESVASATVIAPRSSDADALATALNVMAPAEGLRLADSLPDVACLIVTGDRQAFRSARWPAFERGLVAAAAAPVAVDPAPPHWSDEFELVVDFEINDPPPGEGRYRRPYIAVWVEDENGAVVRNLLLWVSQGGSGPFQWLPDLKRWYKSDQARKKLDKTEMVLTMARATRPPGSYSVSWDGKDDKGAPAPPGKYTLYVDAAREHGTYQGMKQPVTIGGGPSSVEVKGNVEVRSATVSYRRKAPPK